MILRDADILEQLGAIGILRAVSQGRARYAVSHIHRRCGIAAQGAGDAPGQIRLEDARESARPKIDALQAFLQAVDRESEPALF